MCIATGEFISERILRTVADPFFPENEYEALSEAMLAVWRNELADAGRKVLPLITHKNGSPSSDEIVQILSVYRDRLSGSGFTKRFSSDVTEAISSSYHKGKREVNAEHYQSLKAANKGSFSIQVVDGMSEMEAIHQLREQIVIAAGDFWDERLQESLRSEMHNWLTGDLTREEFIAKFKTLVNDRLVNEGRSTLGDHYFRQLAHHSVVRTRTVAKFARAKELNAKGYKLTNPMDKRTSSICRTLVSRGTTYPLSAAQAVVNDLLTFTNTKDLKARQPFITSVSEVDNGRTPFPPITWGQCRTGIRIIFSDR